ncbi:MAG: amidohydrolase [Clostridia bacterium]|nr:amidohydrolase [Clostridia bacterium]
MKTRFFNASIVNFDGQRPFITEGELWVSDDRIAFVGTPEAIPSGFDREIDCSNKLLLPGFKNAHTHSAMTFLRSLADDKPLQNWLNEDVFPLERFLTADDIYILTRLAIMEYVAGGVTAAFDMYYHNEAIAQSAIDAGFRMTLCGAVNDFGGSAEAMRDEFLRFNSLHPLISFRLGFHAEYTTSLPLLKDISELAHELRAPVYTHNSETKAEVEGCLARYGKTPTDILNSLGLFDYGGGGFHCVHLNERDMYIFMERKLFAVTNGGSNVKLASGIAPLCEFFERKIPVAIGTDGPASNNCLNFFREMFLATGLQKLRLGADAMDAEKILHSACSVGAHAMQLPDCDSLSVGKQADIVMLNLNRPNMQPKNNLIKNIVYSGSNENVALTMVRGRILYENGEFFVNAESEFIYRRANEIISRIRKQSGR